MTDADDLTAAISERIGVGAGVVDELVDIYRQEQELKRRRVTLAFPDGMGT
jgi:hypothetical protein